MSAKIHRRDQHRQLENVFGEHPDVLAVDRITDRTPSGYPETELVVAADATGGVPPGVLAEIVSAGVSVVAVSVANQPDFRVVVVR